MTSFTGIYIVVLTLIVGSFGKSHKELCTAPDVIPHKNFTLEKMMGTWYIYSLTAKFDKDVEPLENACMKQKMAKTNSPTLPVVIVESWKPVGKKGSKTETSPSYAIPTPGNEASWNVINFDPEQFEEVAESNTIFVKGDYDTYVLHYLCQVTDKARSESMTALTRVQIPGKDLVEKIDRIVEKLGYPLKNTLRVDQNC